MRNTTRFLLAGVLFAASGLASCNTVANSEPLGFQINSAAKQGYIYGFPILLMSETRKAATTYPYVCSMGGPMNAFKQLLESPGPEFRAVVRPNVDTLYSSAFLDLAETPMVLELPEIRDRFYLMAMLDAWTNNFAAPGSQTNDGKARTYLIAGPDWKGTPPQDMEVIHAPTNMVWIIGRTQLLGPDDIENANAVQKKYKLYPLGKSEIKAEPGRCQDAGDLPRPEDTVRKMSGIEFFSELDRLIAENPPPASNSDKLKDIASIGVGPDANMKLTDLSEGGRKALRDGMEQGQKMIDTAFSFATKFQIWSPDPEKVPLGNYDTDYLVRAIVSQIGFGANRNEFAVYQNSGTDSRRSKLDGSKGVYTLTFDDGAPPVKGFWSVTVYTKDGFLFDNTDERYAVGSYSDLTPTSDGLTRIVFSTKKPADTPVENWIPVPEGPFETTIRMYWPEEAILKQDWKTPPIKLED